MLCICIMYCGSVFVLGIVALLFTSAGAMMCSRLIKSIMGMFMVQCYYVNVFFFGSDSPIRSYRTSIPYSLYTSM